MHEFADMVCRDCQTVIVPLQRSSQSAKADSQRGYWYYRCPNTACGVSYSNGSIESQRTKIYARKELNIPLQVRGGLDEALRHSLNIKNRGNKAAKFAFDTSEDAVTWTVFRYLQESHQLPQAVGLQDEPEKLLFWGVQYPASADASVRSALEGILTTELAEDPFKLTEPDVILSCKDHLVFIELKYRSQNDKKPHYKNFPRYLGPGRDLFCAPSSAIEQDGYYELVRNWVVGSLLARTLKKRFLLLNLAAEKCAPSATQFAASLATTEDRKFQFIAWPDILKRLPKTSPAWFHNYVQQKQLSPQL